MNKGIGKEALKLWINYLWRFRLLCGLGTRNP
jgi:hypothetical protein